MSTVTWPVNWAEQSATIQKLEQRIDSLSKSRTPIVIHDITQPSRTEWESAFVEKTGQVPPIVPGTKLVWYDMRHGQMRMFTTAFDLSGGSASSGDIYEWSDAHRERSAYRFLGYVTPRGDSQNAYSRADSETLNFLLDHNTYGRRGLRALRIYFEFNFTAANVALTMTLLPTLPNLPPEYAVYRVTRTGSKNGVVSRSGDDYSSPESPLQLSVPSSEESHPNMGLVGYLHIDLPTNVVTDDGLKNQLAATSVTMVAADFGNTFSGADITIHESAMRLVKSGPIGGSISLTTVDVADYGSSPPPAALNPDNPNKGWVYGLFNNPTGNNLEEFTDDISATV